MLEFILRNHKGIIRNHDDDVDLVSHGIALVAQNATAKVCIAEPLAIIAGINYMNQMHPKVILESLLKSYVKATTQSQRGTLLESIFALNLFESNHLITQLTGGASVRIPSHIRVGVEVTPKLLDEAATFPVFIMPVEKAGPDIIICDGCYLILINLKTTENEALDLESTSMNRLRTDPKNLYTTIRKSLKENEKDKKSKSKDNVQFYEASPYETGIDLVKHKSLQAFLKTKSYNVVRVCVDYPCPAATVNSTNKKCHDKSQQQHEFTWTPGYTTDNVVRRFLIDESNIEDFVGKEFATTMHRIRQSKSG